VGLDMYLEGHKRFYRGAGEEDGFPIKGKTLDLGYWRKHPNLHGFIVQAFAEGVDNCQEIYLGAQDIRNIISALSNDSLPETKGFFFGASDSSQAQREHDMVIFGKALLWLESAPVQPKLEKQEIGMGFILSIPADVELPDEYRDVIYRASW
jgi:hypothetical protein